MIQHSRPVFWRRLYPISLLLATVGGLMVGCGQSSVSSHVAPGDGPLVLELRVSGSRVHHNPGLISRLAGDANISKASIVAIACYNAGLWADDVTLAPNAVLSDNPGVLRSAELLKSGEFDPKLVAAVELHYWDTGKLEIVPAMQKQGFASEAVGAYLAARARPAAPGVEERFAVFGSAETTTEQGIFYLDLGSLRDDRATGLAAGTSIAFLPSANGLSLDRHEIPTSDCEPAR